MTGGGIHSLFPGQISDDTEMALCLARSLVREKCLYRHDVAVSYAYWMQSGPVFAGKNTKRVLSESKFLYLFFTFIFNFSSADTTRLAHCVFGRR